MAEQRRDPLLHHRFGPFSFQREIFEHITCASAVLDDPLTACRDIDAACRPHAATADRCAWNCRATGSMQQGCRPRPAESGAEEGDPSALEEAVDGTLRLLAAASTPAILTGVEIHRRGLQDSLTQLVLNACIPVAATLTGKSVVGERHPACLGVYEGAMGPDDVRTRIADADLLLGATVNEVDTGIFTAQLDPARLIHASRDRVTIGHHRYPGPPRR